MPRTAHHTGITRQRGAALLVMLVIMIMGATTVFLGSINGATVQIERDKKTAAALAQAREALIGRAVANANHPGSLPCPDNHLPGTLEGTASPPCSSNALGRLPWKTLGLPDLRDASGERLWYALSPNFRDSTNIVNSDTKGTLQVYDSTGTTLLSSEVIAIIFAPQSIVSSQQRDTANYNLAQNYLDIGPSSINNAIAGGPFINANKTNSFNDSLMIIRIRDLMPLVERRVVKEVGNALNEYYCGIGNVNIIVGGCLTAGGNRYYPRPASFSDVNCLGNSSILSNCISVTTTNNGRIPANPAIAWDNVYSILRGSIGTGNWFQSNAWREVIFYAVATACTDGTSNCSGAGYLTLHNPAGSTLSNQKVVVIATGGALSTTSPAQARTIPLKNSINNYLEDENLSPLDDVYTRGAVSPSNPFNDVAISIP